MAEASRRWTWPLAAAALLICAMPPGLAQSVAGGSLSGKLTNLHSSPVGEASVVVRNVATGAESRTTTAKNGAFRFSTLEAGEYTLEATSNRLGRGSLSGILVDTGEEVRVQMALRFALPPPQPLHLVRLWIEMEAVPAVAKIEMDPPAALPLPERRMLLPAPVRPELLIVKATVEEGAAEAEAVISAAALEQEQSSHSDEAAQGGSFSTKDSLRNIGTPYSNSETAVTGEQVRALPASGRRWEEFALDRPPETGQTSSEMEGAERGVVRAPEAVSVDGMSRALAFGAGSTRMRGRGSAMAGAGVGQVAVAEVRSSAYGTEAAAARSAASGLDVETRHGSNRLHGQAFVFDRQNNWGARNPFTQWVKETAPGTSLTIPVFTAEPYTPPDHEVSWGAGLGSRIRRDRLFWFGSVDGSGRNDPGVASLRHADEFFLQPSENTLRVLGARLEESGTKPIEDYSKMLETLAGLLGPAPRTAMQWTGFGRLDWEASERHRFTLEGTGARQHALGGGMTRTAERFGNHSFGSSAATETWLLGRWEVFLTENLLAVTQVSAGRTIEQALPETPSAFEQELLAMNSWGQLPQIVVDSRYGFTIGNPSRYGAGSYPDEHRCLGQESVDWVHGGLLVKAGFRLSHNDDATSLLRNQTGTYYYSNVANFISDALAFQYFASDPLDPSHQHGCDQTGRVWANAAGPQGRGPLPCYSYYTQTIGPAGWRLSTNDWAAYAQTQWQAGKRLVLSAGLRWEREQLPQPIAAVNNPQLPLTQSLPNLGNSWGPRLGLAWGTGENHWPVLRLGYGMYFGRTENAVLETALSQTGSPNGDLNMFMRPSDDLPQYGGGAPPFPYVPSGLPGKVVKPGAVELAPSFRNSEIHQGVTALEERLPGHIAVTASALVSLGRRLPSAVDTNLATPSATQTITYSVKDTTGAGPIKSAQITVPFYAAWPGSTEMCPYYVPTAGEGLPGRPCPDYQQITELTSRANSTYEAAVLSVARTSRRGLSFHARYTYAHATDWNPNESSQITGSDPLDPADFKLEYGASNLDIRHRVTGMVIYEAPWKLRGAAGKLGNGWMVSGIGNFHSGMPYTMRTAGSLSGIFLANGDAVEALAPGMNGSGGDNRVYGMGSDGVFYDVGRNTFRYPSVWKADMRLAKHFSLGQSRELELLAESFNLFNHQNVTELETIGYYVDRGTSLSDPPTLTFLNGLETNSTAFGQPLNINSTNYYRERQIQFGLRMRF